MNYFLTSVCCVLIIFTVGRTVSDSYEEWQELHNCIKKVDEFLGQITLDESLEKLVETARNFDLKFLDFVAERYVPLKPAYREAFHKIAYPETCDTVLSHFKLMKDEVECFEPKLIPRIHDKDDSLKNLDVIWAGLACSYISRWRKGGGSSPILDFAGSSEAREECIRGTAASLDTVTLDASMQKLAEKNREFDITSIDFSLRSSRPLSPAYQLALQEMDLEEGCDDLDAQIVDAIRQVKCYAEHIKGDATALVQLSTMNYAGDVLVAYQTCLLRFPHQDGDCRRKCVKFLDEISLDESVKKLVEGARKLGMTHAHFEAAKYKRLDDERERELEKIGYPEGCPAIEKHFSTLPERVKCTKKRSFDVIFDWMLISKLVEGTGDKVLAGWACAYASKFAVTRPEAPESVQPVEMSEAQKERKRLYDGLANILGAIPFGAPVKKVLEIVRGCKLAFVDFVLVDYRPLDRECSDALLKPDFWQGCTELIEELGRSKEIFKFYRRELWRYWVNFLEVLSVPASEQVLLASEACGYILDRVHQPSG